MSGLAYYNECDPYAAEWLRNLIAAGLITAGDVDERSIVDVRPSDLEGYERCHFFAGIGGWDYALRLAGWPAGRPVWTGSAPCQPFSSAARGRNAGIGDDRDLWPVNAALIAARQPPVFFGEQVASSGAWVDRAGDDLEAMGYAFWASVLSSLGIGADHLRPRVYFVGHADSDGQSGLPVDAEAPRLPWRDREPGGVVPPHGLPARVAVLRAFGNAIDPRVAAAFIGAVIDTLSPTPTPGGLAEGER